MAVASSQTPSLWREEVLATGGACARLLESWGQAARGHPRCWERIWATAPGAVQQRVESELRLAGKEQTAVRRAALRRLLLDEYQQHQQELRQLGKAFYVERLWSAQPGGLSASLASSSILAENKTC